MITLLKCEKCGGEYPWPLLIAGEVCHACFRFSIEGLLPSGSATGNDADNPGKQTDPAGL